MSGLETALAAAAGVAVFVVGLALSVALHEVGHLLPAKAFGVKVTQYMVGFGPTLWSRRRGETEYGVKAVPLGGYVRMVGMYAPARAGAPERTGSTGVFASMTDDARRLAAEEVAPGEEHRTFHGLSVPKRLVIMLGGPFVNLVLATVLLGGYLVVVGLPVAQPGAVVAAVSACAPVAGSTATAGSGASTGSAAGCPAGPSPAAAAGLVVGDRLVSVAGEAITSTAQVGALVRPRAGQQVPVVVERDGQRLDLVVVPVTAQVAQVGAEGQPVLAADGSAVTAAAGYLGISSAAPAEVVPQPVSAVPGFVASAAVRTAGVIIDLPARMVGVAQAAFGSAPRDPDGPIGVVGVGRLSGEIATSDLFTSTGQRVAAITSVLGSLNMALFVFNLVPLLPLDGGHVAGALWEGARRRLAALRGRPDPGPFDLARLLPVTYVVTLLLVGMSVLLLYADVVRPVTLGG